MSYTALLHIIELCALLGLLEARISPKKGQLRRLGLKSLVLRSVLVMDMFIMVKSMTARSTLIDATRTIDLMR
jgi:hypothetical protein